MAIPNPLILDDAGVKIGDGADPTEAFIELACVTNHVELSPDTAVTTLDTLCGSVDYPGAVKWALVLTLYQSFDAGATEEALSKAVEAGGPVGYKILPYKSQPVSALNPLYQGEVIPQAYSPINGDAGDASTIELEWACTGAPEKLDTGTYAVAAGTLAELQAEAEALGLSTSGTKADIAARIEAHKVGTPA